ncbi:hypothetical protein EHI8A_163960 [Entamoeba histolytica HM-1:IMSS-B]|uniref:Uncharacterized protein n=1 Tax=Entamoeba histolytica HM-1:IMSS-B TaxID=885319 RepID=M3TPJ2_ENTH1|nr:hypothetical protein EHI8A_163960 [Entamoeba histolytica HM-1:IMSS-B]
MRRGGVGTAGDRIETSLQLTGLAQALGDLLGEAEPGGGAVGRQVIGAPEAIVLVAVGQQALGGVGDGPGPGGCADLVVDDVQFVALAEQPHHGAQEVVALPGIDPASAQDEVAFGVFAHGVLASQFGPAIDIERTGRILFPVTAFPGAIEDVVGGVVDHGDAQLLRRPGEDLGHPLVDQGRGLGVALRGVHGGIGGGIDDDIGLCGQDAVMERVQLGEIHLGPADDGYLGLGGQQFLQRLRELAVLTGDEDVHVTELIPEGLARPCLIDRVGVATTALSKSRQSTR